MGDTVIGTEAGNGRPAGVEDTPQKDKGPSETAGQEVKGEKQNELDPSAPGETGTTPGSNGK